MSHAFVKSAAVVAALVASLAIAGAQSYPTKPINFIATEVPGSATDIQARVAAISVAGCETGGAGSWTEPAPEIWTGG